MKHTQLWWFGQLVALVVGLALRHEGHSFAVSFAVYAILAILADIRENTQK